MRIAKDQNSQFAIGIEPKVINSFRRALLRQGSRPIYRRLVDLLEAAIANGELTDGMRLPSERSLAEQLAVSRTTVACAFRELESRGLVRSHVGSGTFVCAQPGQRDGPFAWRGKVSASARINADPVLGTLLSDVAQTDLISFARGIPALECFPVSAYQRLSEKTLRTDPESALGLGPAEGHPRLRQALASFMRTKPERILVLSGSQQGLDLIARCLIDPGDGVIIERPGYVGAIQTFRAAGANLIGWDVTRCDMDELEDLIVRYRPKCIYTNPTFQNPTGKVLRPTERQELLSLAARYRIPLIEGDPLSQTYLDTPPPKSLYQMDEDNVVIYYGSFSKILAPGLRLGWLAASEYIVEQLSVIKQRASMFTGGLNQMILAEFLETGLFEEHMTVLRKEHARRREALIAALERHVSPRQLTFNRPSGGLHFWCRLGRGLRTRPLLQRCRSNGVAFANGEIFYPDGAGGDDLRLCFANLPVDKIWKGVGRLAQSINEELENGSRPESAVPFV